MILNGDTLIEPEIARRVLAARPAPVMVTSDRKSHYDSDDMKVANDGELLRAIGKPLPMRSEGRRVGKVCGSKCRSRWSPEHKNKQSNKRRAHLEQKL